MDDHLSGTGHLWCCAHSPGLLWKAGPHIIPRFEISIECFYWNYKHGTFIDKWFFMANTVTELRHKNNTKAQKHLLTTMLFGDLFLDLKSLDSSKMDARLLLDSNTFFTFYWMLMLFPAIHVAVGLGLLSFIFFGIIRKNKNPNMEDDQAIAAFWHMCDLIWLLLFPVIYLIF